MAKTEASTISSHITKSRLKEDIQSTGEFGALSEESGHGRTAITGSEANARAREYLVQRLEDADLDIRIDAVGNIVGTWIPEGVDRDTPAVATGSHLDSVAEGGIFDGVLGVYAGLESIRAMQEADIRPVRPIKVVSFTEEEGGRFGDGVLGSSVAVGEQSVEEALERTDENGRTLEEALTEAGFQGKGRIDASSWDSWLEVHVEQGTRIESSDASAGIVTDITGTVRCKVDIAGEANHAGTTSMRDRADALAAASEIVLEIESKTNELVASQNETAVGTVGQFEVEPNCINVIPGAVRLGIDIRDIQRESMEEVVTHLEERLDQLEQERGVETQFERPYDIDPIAMDKRCVEALREASDALDLITLDLHSGAGHDTMQVAKITPSGMIFAPSRGGISHSPQEWTDWEDCLTTTQLLAHGLGQLALK